MKNAASGVADHADKVTDSVEQIMREIIAFGDQYNDLEMLQLAGTGYAMKNAASGVADHADKVTDSVEQIMREILETE